MEHPMQPIEKDDQGVVRFRENKIVGFLLDAGPFDMNQIAKMPFSVEDRRQFAQLIGYSVCGYGELSYAEDHPSVAEADAVAEQLACVGGERD